MSKTKNNTLRKDSIENRYKTYYGFNTLIIQQFQYSNTLYPIENGFSEKKLRRLRADGVLSLIHFVYVFQRIVTTRGLFVSCPSIVRTGWTPFSCLYEIIRKMVVGGGNGIRQQERVVFLNVEYHLMVCFKGVKRSFIIGMGCLYIKRQLFVLIGSFDGSVVIPWQEG